MNTEAVAHYIAEWMSGYLDGTGAAGFVVGVSGYRFGGSFDAGGYDRAQNALRDIAYPS